MTTKIIESAINLMLSRGAMIKKPETIKTALSHQRIALNKYPSNPIITAIIEKTIKSMAKEISNSVPISKIPGMVQKAKGRRYAPIPTRIE